MASDEKGATNTTEGRSKCQGQVKCTKTAWRQPADESTKCQDEERTPSWHGREGQDSRENSAAQSDESRRAKLQGEKGRRDEVCKCVHVSRRGREGNRPQKVAGNPDKSKRSNSANNGSEQATGRS